MNDWKNKTGRPRPSNPKPPRSSSMYDFQNMGNIFPSAPGSIPYFLSSFPLDVLYMEISRRLFEERKSQSCEWGSIGGRRRHGTARSPRVDRIRPGTPDPNAFSPRRPHTQFYQPQFYHPMHETPQMYVGHDNWVDPLIEKSSSSENLTPCSSCRCCRYFNEPRSIVDIVGRARCGRRYVNHQALGRKREERLRDCGRCGGMEHDCGVGGGHSCKRGRAGATPPEPQPELGRAQSGHRRGASGGENCGGVGENEETEPERDVSDESSDGGPGKNSGERARPEFREIRGSGDELQTASAERRPKPRNKSTSYFLPC